jgi:hypothetical protein
MHEINSRIRRLFTAIKGTYEPVLTKFPAHIRATHNTVCVFQDFSGGMPESEMENAVQNLIALVASLEYHLQKWAAKNGRNPDRVRWTFETSEPLKVIHDLWNNEKHGYPPPRGRDRTGRKPRLTHVRRRMQLKTRAQKGSWCQIQMAANGMPVASGDGAAGVIISGDVVDDHEATMGDIHDVLQQSIGECEKLLENLGIPVSSKK